MSRDYKIDDGKYTSEKDETLNKNYNGEMSQNSNKNTENNTSNNKANLKQESSLNTENNSSADFLGLGKGYEVNFLPKEEQKPEVKPLKEVDYETEESRKKKISFKEIIEKKRNKSSSSKTQGVSSDKAKKQFAYDKSGSKPFKK